VTLQILPWLGSSGPLIRTSASDLLPEVRASKGRRSHQSNRFFAPGNLMVLHGITLAPLRDDGRRSYRKASLIRGREPWPSP
jgi:hypothetical protein